jgi:hypothetical protein
MRSLDDTPACWQALNLAWYRADRDVIRDFGLS